MFSIVITEKGGAQHQLDFDGAEIGIGRQDDNELCLPKNNVSKHHARLFYKDDRYVIVDHQSTNGTYVNGRRISGPSVVRHGDKIYIGDFILTLSAAGAPGAATPSAGARSTGLRPNLAEGAANAQHAMITTATDVPEELRRAQTQRRRPPHQAGSSPAPPRPASTSEVREGRPSPPPLPRSPSNHPSSSPASRPAPSASRAGPERAREAVQAAHQDPGGAPRRGRTQPLSSGSPPSAAKRGGSDGSPLPPQRASVPPRRSASSIPPLPPLARAAPPADSSVDSAHAAALSGLTSPAVLAPSVRLQSALSLLMERLAPHLDIQREEESAFPGEHQALLDRLIDKLADEGVLAQDIDRALLREAAIHEAVGLGPLERLLVNRQVREIVVDGPTRVLADLGGGLTPLSSFFSDDSAVLVVAARLLHRAGRKLDRRQAVHEAQLPNGGTMQLLLPPLSPRGPLLAIRCPPRAQRAADSYLAEGALSPDMLALLRGALVQRRNVLVLGPMGAGVSELLLLLASLVPDHERIVTIEESPSASLLNPQVMPLCRRALPELALTDLLQRAALLRPDRLLIDDLRVEEASSALIAAAGGGGVLLGMHAPDPKVALSLLSHSAGLGLGGNPVPSSALVAAALQLFVHVGPDASGQRRVLSIEELQPGASGAPELRLLFRCDGNGGFVASFLNR